MVLVEDESFERSSIAKYIDWDLVGVRIIGEAANGSQGLSIVMDAKPDIVLTDVKMPIMDGIEMARRIRAELPKVKIIFLSSYDDFEYARQAIDLSISAYLMKPVKESELLRVIKRVADEISEDRIEQRIQKKLQNNYEISANLAKQALVNRILTGIEPDEGDARQLGLEWLLQPSRNLCLLISIYDAAGFADSIDAYMELLNQQCAGLCKRAINICIHAGILITICMLEDDSPPDATEKIHGLIKAFFSERRIAGVRVESARGTGGGQSLSDLYMSIVQRESIAYDLKPKPAKAKNKRQIADEIVSIIRENYQQPLSLESIAKSLFFTPNYLGMVFKSIMNTSVNQFLMTTRLEKAIELLSKTDMPVNDIAIKCGYGSITYFYKVFKAEKGVTPNEFRSLGKTPAAGKTAAAGKAEGASKAAAAGKPTAAGKTPSAGNPAAAGKPPAKTTVS